MSELDEKLSKDDFFRILSNFRRRYVIYYLKEVDREVSLRELATQIAARENEVSPESITDEERQRVYISLYQTHLPKLEEHDIVDYDEDRRMVRLTPAAQSADLFRIHETPAGRPWHMYYGAVAAAGLLLLIVVALGVLPFLSWTAAALLTTLGVVAVATAHYLDATQHRGGGSFEELVE